MKNVLTGGTCTAAVLAFSLAAFAQTGQTAQTGTTPSQAHGQHGDPNQQMTLVGCVQTEAEYRAARNAGSGGVVGTGVGVGNEFVLVNATMSHAKGADASPTGATTGTATGTGATTGTATGSTATGATTGTMTTPGQTTGTSGSTPMGDAYELTGPSEGQLAAYVGRRVEITGRLKADSGVAAGGTTTGTTSSGTGTTSGTASGTVTGGTVTGTAPGRPQTGGMDVLGQDLKLREFEVISVRAVEGTCPALPRGK